MSSAAATNGYRRAIAKRGETVSFTRVTGLAPNATLQTVQIKAIVMDYVPQAAVMGVKREGSITQGARHLIVIEADLGLAGYPIPLAKNDKVLVRGETLNVSSVDPSKRGYGSATEVVAVGV